MADRVGDLLAGRLRARRERAAPRPLRPPYFGQSQTNTPPVMAA
jgi:hypothetical protein